ncbi:ArgP/LysG family DNA-binding transcriptional regulator [Sedimentitalea arenosa]|uniref:ArgP/LysG family DNA-binding transcriptional regulator n=1 Tax=Sedimentitalea arenosa TaxID=2798803 RepID=A0A8J7JEY6_9RHOB|nr:ArgP/LysG family DNA-binding transcriptional regulator [Arenibacterium arenosum]MBJ6370204.1 ArgP/LysG family DNA-binding transcriptional regulator [Arenibacterium arenosum]
MQFDPQQLAALAAVLRRGSFDAAAADLSVTASAVSQRIKALEDRVGSALIRRGAPCTATPAGQRLAKHAEDVALLEAQVSRDLALKRGSGAMTLRVAVNADSLATWFVAAMAAVPDVLFDLVIDDQDHSSDWLKRGAVSAAISAQEKPAPGCDAIPLGSLRYVATASPAFMRRWFADGLTAETLSRAPCLTFNAKDMLQRRWIAETLGLKLSPPTHFLPSTHAFVEAARRGVGWGMNPEALVREPIRDSLLVPLQRGTHLDVALTWQVSRVMAQALKPVTDSVRMAARKELVAPGA